MKEFINEVFFNGKRYGIVQTISLYSKENKMILISHNIGTAGERLEYTLDEFNQLLKDNKISKLYVRI